MEKIIIVYGSTTGTTEEMSQIITREIKSLGLDVAMKNVSNFSPEELSEYELIILGCPTWGDGELQEDFIDFEEKLRSIDLKDKRCAVFGPGESMYSQFSAFNAGNSNSFNSRSSSTNCEYTCTGR